MPLLNISDKYQQEVLIQKSNGMEVLVKYLARRFSF